MLRHENEANKFAAELLIDLNSIDKCYIEELSLEQLARFMMVPKELIELKFQK